MSDNYFFVSFWSIEKYLLRFVSFNSMVAQKSKSSEIIGKTVVSKSGRKFGMLGDLIFESRTGELIYLSVKSPTAYCLSLDLEKSRGGEHLVPFSAVISTGDFVIVAEEDIV